MREEQPRAHRASASASRSLLREGTGIGPYEGAKVQVQGSGKVSVATGIGTQGQGHYTAFAQIVADQVGVDVRDVDVVTGDTDQFYWGAGTFASRGAVVAGSACHAHGGRQKICTPRRAFRVRRERTRDRERRGPRVGLPGARQARDLGGLRIQRAAWRPAPSGREATRIRSPIGQSSRRACP